ncbi:type II toxin-antitoxin system HicA family toxin [Candidatus Woesearchaeota archaeon]|nr:type II toxin-antitoxin system HicA family toxin [Candidatus Woesearchaeota archaeon]
MLKLPLLSSREICSFLEKEEFQFIRQNGSHRFYRHPDGRTVVIPVHTNKDIKRGLLQGILSEIHMSREEFLKKYR